MKIFENKWKLMFIKNYSMEFMILRHNVHNIIIYNICLS